MREHIRQLAIAKRVTYYGMRVERDDLEVLFRYVYLWLFLPIWYPTDLFLTWLASLGRRLR